MSSAKMSFAGVLLTWHLLQNTAIKRWDLVCGRKYMPRLIQTIFFVGNFVGVLLSGVVADR